MTITGLETALLGGMIATAAGFAGMIVKGWVAGSQCEKCGIEGLRAEIRAQCQEIRAQSKMIRLLAEKAGVTVMEQIEIEKAMHMAD